MRIFKLVGLLFFITIFVSLGFSQKKLTLNKYLKIKVFESTREDVEKIYGKGESGSNPYFVLYKTPDGNVSVGYSYRNCQYEYPMWNVPDWTVEDITYRPFKNPPKLKALISDKSQFKSRQSGDVINHIEYYDDERGISIIYDTSVGKVKDIIIRPSFKDIQKYDCDLIKKNN